MIWCDGERLPHWKLLEVSCEPIEKPTRNGYSREWMASVDKYATVTLWDGTIYHGPLIQDERNGEDMSNLYWKPAQEGKGPLSKELRVALVRHYGALRGGHKLTSEAKPVLDGMLAAGIDDAAYLTAAIQEYGSIIVTVID